MSANELQKINDAVLNLRRSIGSVNSLWRDEKYTQLSESVIGVAHLSRRLVEAGRQYEQSAAEFDRIANESV